MPTELCLPCKKEIINQRAAEANAVSKIIAAGIVAAVRDMRLESADATSLLNALIAADEVYIAAIATIEADYLGKVGPIW